MVRPFIFCCFGERLAPQLLIKTLLKKLLLGGKLGKNQFSAQSFTV